MLSRRGNEAPLESMKPSLYHGLAEKTSFAHKRGTHNRKDNLVRPIISALVAGILHVGSDASRDHPNRAMQHRLEFDEPEGDINFDDDPDTDDDEDADEVRRFVMLSGMVCVDGLTHAGEIGRAHV